MDRLTPGEEIAPPTEPASRVDGRRQRSARTRQAIVEAYLALLRYKPRLPTAEQVARKATLSERAVFAHFPDMPALGIAAFDYVMAVRPLTPVGDEINAGREARIEFQVRLRANTCETWLPLWRGVMVAQCGSPEVERRVNVVHELMRRRLQVMYSAELDCLTSTDRVATLNALEGVLSFDSWGRLREHYKLSYDAACKAWIRTIDRLLPPTP